MREDSLEERRQSRLVVVQEVQVVGIRTEGHLGHLWWHHVLHLMLLLPLHASVLEPDFYLSFAEAECVSDFDASPSG